MSNKENSKYYVNENKYNLKGGNSDLYTSDNIKTSYFDHSSSYSVEPTNPTYEFKFPLDGLWLVKKNGQRLILENLSELEDPIPYGKMMKDNGDILATYLSYKARNIIDLTFKCDADGCIRYTIPASAGIAMDILKFLAMSQKEQEGEIKRLKDTNTRIDEDGNVRDEWGKILYAKETLESLIVQEKELKKQLREIRRLKKEAAVDALDKNL